MSTVKRVRARGWWARGLALLAGLAASACAATSTTTPAKSAASGPQYMIVGIDEKVTWDEAGRIQLLPPGKDLVTIVDITTREAPRIVASLPLMNSVFGPPTNLAITPDEHVAIVANSMAWVREGTSWKSVPDNKLYVIDLTASPPREVATVEVGKQPSGLAINASGDLVLVANRADNSISVLSLHGTTLKLIDTVAM